MSQKQTAICNDSLDTVKKSEFETYEEIVNGHLYPVYNYRKHSLYCEGYETAFRNDALGERIRNTSEKYKHQRKTGNSLFSNELPRYGMFDADIKHGIPDEEVKRIHEIFFSKIPEDINKTIQVI